MTEVQNIWLKGGRPNCWRLQCWIFQFHFAVISHLSVLSQHLLPWRFCQSSWTYSLLRVPFRSLLPCATLLTSALTVKSLITSQILMTPSAPDFRAVYLLDISETNVMSCALSLIGPSDEGSVQIHFQTEIVGDLVSETHTGEPCCHHHVVLRNSSTFDRGAEEWWTG